MKRWWAAIANSWNGIVACARSEAAFREEIVALVLAIPAAMVLAADPWKRSEPDFVVITSCTPVARLYSAE